MALTISLKNGGPDFIISCPGLHREVTPEQLVERVTAILKAQREIPPLTLEIPIRKFTHKGKPERKAAPKDLDIGDLDLEGIV